MTPILSLWLPHLPTDRLAGAGGGGPEGLVTVAKVGGAQRVAAVDRRAAAGAIRPGMTLADARAVRPGLRVEQADPRRDAKTLDRIADWCGRFTPMVALDGPDGLLLDIAGAAHLFGGVEDLVEAAGTGLAALGFEARGAVAATPEAAWALARFGAVRMAPDRTDAEAFRRVFGSLEVVALRIGDETVQALAQAGLRRIDDLLDRPRAPLAARFGEALLDRLDAVMGTRRTPIGPRFDPPAFVAEQRFASPIVLAGDVERTLLALSCHLGALLERHRKGARRIEAQFFRVDGVVKRIAVGTSRPLHRGPDMARLFREKIEALGEEGLDTGYGFDVVRLAVREAEASLVRQEELAAVETEAGTNPDDLADLVDRLGARLGLRRVTRLVGQDRHVPEFAVRAVAVAEAGAPARSDPGGEALLRPIRLFSRPEPIEAVAAVPDGPPLRFRWRRALHELAAVEGPERIAPEWWKPGAPGQTRDYFRAEDREGRRYWLFREGLFAAENAVAAEATVAEALTAAETDQACEPDAPAMPRPRWFLHGLFG